MSGEPTDEGPRVALVERLTQVLTPVYLRGGLDPATLWRVFGECGGWDVFDRADPEVLEWGEEVLALVGRRRAERERLDRETAAGVKPLLERFGRWD